MQSHRIAQLVISAVLAVGALVFAMAFLIGGLGELQWNAYAAMSCAFVLMTIGSIGMFLSKDWGRIASLAFFYFALAFNLVGPISVLAVSVIGMFLVALHAMKPPRKPHETISGAD